MVIKKYQAETENEAMILVKEDLGKDAIVMNIKSIKPKGMFRLFRKPLVEITAAYDEASSVKAEKEATLEPAKAPVFNKEYGQALMRGDILVDGSEAKKDEESSAIEVKLDNLQSMLEKQMVSETIKVEEKKEIVESIFDNSCVKLIVEKLVDSDVTEENVNSIIKEIENRIT